MILSNAGEESSVIIVTLLVQYGVLGNFAWGYDMQNGVYVDVIKAWIVDLLKVVRTALVDMAGVMSLLMMSDACVVETLRRISLWAWAVAWADSDGF